MEYSSIGSLYDVLTRERRYRRAVRRARRVPLWRAVVLGWGCWCTRKSALTDTAGGAQTNPEILREPSHILSNTRRLFLMRDACAGLAFLHAQNPPLLHGDIKSLNMLIGTVQLAVQLWFPPLSGSWKN